MSCDEGRPCKRCIARGCADQCRGQFNSHLANYYFPYFFTDGKRKRRGRKRKDDSGEEEENELSDECKVDTILNDNSFNSSNESSLVSTEEEQVSSCISIPIPFCTNEYLTHLYDAENIRTAIYGSLEDYVFSHYPELIKSSFSTKCSSESLCDNSDVYRSFYSDGIDPELLLQLSKFWFKLRIIINFEVKYYIYRLVNAYKYTFFLIIMNYL